MTKSLGPRVAIIGAAECTQLEAAVAEEVGQLLARAGAVVLSGGRGGIMEAACRGAGEAGGLTVGILPGNHASDANPWVALPLPTGLGEARNAVLMRSAEAVIAIGGEYGTLSEIALALKFGRPVFGLDTWRAVNSDDLEIPVRRHHTAAQVVAAVLAFLDQPSSLS